MYYFLSYIKFLQPAAAECGVGAGQSRKEDAGTMTELKYARHGDYKRTLPMRWNPRLVTVPGGGG
jgi:hypothetical protein